MITGRTTLMLVNIETLKAYYSKTFAGLAKAAELTTTQVKYLHKQRRIINGWLCIEGLEYTLDRVQTKHLKRL